MSEVVHHLSQTELSEECCSGKLRNQMEVGPSGDAVIVTNGETDVIITTSSHETLSPVMHTVNIPSTSEIQHKEALAPSNLRNKTLIRGQTVDEETSPPPESVTGQVPHSKGMSNGHLMTCELAPDSADKMGKLKSQLDDATKDFLDSGHGTMDDASDTSILSRDSSLENASVGDLYKDSSGVDIPNFVRETLTKSLKDKKTILSLEDQLLNFVHNGVPMYKMAEMTSYERMIVHRLAAFLGIEHNVDSSGKCIVLNRTEITRSVKLTDIFLCEDSHRETKKKILLKKQPASFDERNCRGSSKLQFGSHRAKSLEERQQNYNEARERIFKDGEGQCEEDFKSCHYLTVNYVPQVYQQSSQESLKTNAPQPSQWACPDPSINGSHKESAATHGSSSSSIASYNHVPNHSTQSQVSTISTDHQPGGTISMLPEIVPSIATQMPSQGHTNGLMYHFDTTCPPPFITQPLVPPPTGPVLCHEDTVSDMTAKLGAVSVGSADQGAEAYALEMPGMPMPAIMVHPHSMYPPNYSPHIPQGQVIVCPSAVGVQQQQQPVKYFAIPYPQSQQLIPQSVVDKQGQTTVPMPTVGLSTVSAPGKFHVISSPGQPPVAVANPPYCVDMNSVAYHYRAIPEAMVPSGAGSLSSPAAPGSSHLVLAYAQPHPQHPAVLGHYIPSGIVPAGTSYYTIPVANPPASQSLMSPPTSHYEPHPTILYTSNIGNALSSSSSSYQHSSPSSLSSSLKNVQQPPLFSTQPQHQSQQVVISQSNGHQAPHLALNYSHPIRQGPPAHRPQFVAFHTSPYQVRPAGPTLFHLAAGSVAPTPQLGSGLQMQPYQLIRPTGTISDIRLMNPSSIRSGISPLQIASSNPQQQTQSSQYYQQKKELKKVALLVDDCPGSQVTGPVGHLNIIAPINASGSTQQTYNNVVSYSSSNRQ